VRACEILRGEVPPPECCEPLYTILAEHAAMFDRMLMAQAKRTAAKGAHMVLERSSERSSFMTRMSSVS